jgi:flagellar hook-associated protein 3 FlgL
MTGSVTNSTLAFYRRASQQMGTLRASAESLQNQLSTGERLSRSSDDPVAASQLRMLSRDEVLAGIDAANARRTSENLELADNALGAIAEDLIRVRELVLWASSDTMAATERATIGEEVEQLRLRILSSMNARDAGGNALFGGETSGDAYAIDGAGGITYVGTASAGDIDLGQGQVLSRGITGPEVMNFTTGGALTDVFAFLGVLASSLQGGVADPVQAARDGLTGIDDAVESLTRAQTVVGTRIAWIDVIEDRQIDQSQTRAARTAATGGVPFAETVAELQQMLTVLEASQAGFVKLACLILFDSIR